MRKSLAAGELPLGELRTATGTTEPRLLAFLHPGIAGEEALLAELVREVAVVTHQGAGNALHAGSGLTRIAAAVDQDLHVDAFPHATVLQRRDHRVAVLVDREELRQLALVDRELARAGADSHAGPRRFAAAGSRGGAR